LRVVLIKVRHIKEVISIPDQIHFTGKFLRHIVLNLIGFILLLLINIEDISLHLLILHLHLDVLIPQVHPCQEVTRLTLLIFLLFFKLLIVMLFILFCLNVRLDDVKEGQLPNF
jgi:hypothetical protein